MNTTDTGSQLDARVRTLDPDPITTGSFIFAAIGAATAVGALLRKIVYARELTRSKQRKLFSIADQASKTAEALVEDLEQFDTMWRFGVVQIKEDRYFVWDLQTYDYHALKKLLSRLTSAYKTLIDLQNRIGELELDIIGDRWRFHSIETSTSSFRLLASVQSGEDAVRVKDELKQMLSEYINSVNKLNEMLGDLREGYEKR